MLVPFDLKLCDDTSDQTNMSAFLKPTYARTRRTHIKQFDQLLQQIRIRLRKKKSQLRLDLFYSQDGWARIEEIPETDDHAIVSFPPTYRNGYERLYKTIHQAFAWDQPTYRELTADETFTRRIANWHGKWIIGLEEPIPEIEPILGAPVAFCPRGSTVNIVLYSNIAGLRTHLVRRHLSAERPRLPFLRSTDPIHEDSRFDFVRITKSKANYLRQLFVSVRVSQADAVFNYAVRIDGRFIGLLMFTPEVRFSSGKSEFVREESIYLMCDLAIPHERYKRLSKLVLLAAVSQEMNAELEMQLVRRVSWIGTTAFSQHPQSMKYRGLGELLGRKERQSGRFVLNYFMQFKERTLKELLKTWMIKHSSPPKPGSRTHQNYSSEHKPNSELYHRGH